MRVLFLAALLVGTSSFAQIHGSSSGRCASSSTPSSSSTQTLLLSYLPTNGEGMASGDPCDRHAGWLSGNYYCLRGDGTYVSPGGLTLTNTSTTTTTANRCPNGASCGSASDRTFSGSGQYYTVTASASPNNLTMCMAATMTAAPASRMALIDKIGGGSNFAWQWDIRGGGPDVHFIAYKDDSTSNDVGDNLVLPQNERHVFCASYHFVLSGSSVIKTYRDGVLQQSITNAVGPLQATGTVTPRIGRNDFNTGDYFQGSVGSVFYTEQLLTDSQVATLSSTMQFTGSGTLGEFLTSTTTAANCVNAAVSISTPLVANIPCVTDGGLHVSSTEKASLVNPLTKFAKQWTIGATAFPSGGDWTAAAAKQGILALGDSYGGSNSASFYVDATGHPTLEVYDSGAVLKKIVANSALSSSSHTLTASTTSTGTLSLTVDGMAASGVTTGLGSGRITVQPSNLWLGSAANGSNPLTGRIGAVTITSSSILKGLAWNGDSLTAGTWNTAGKDPVSDLGVSLGSAWQADNLGVSGNTTSQCRTNWETNAQGKKYTWHVYWCGINDLIAGTPAATFYAASSRPELTEMLADSGHVIVILTIPWKSNSNWSSGKQTETDNYNNLLLQWCASTGQTCIDKRLAFSTGDSQTLSVTCDQRVGGSPDGLHIGDVCASQMAAAVLANIP